MTGRRRGLCGKCSAVRTGLRPQVILLLAILLLLTFFPLYFAISTYTRTAHQRVLQQQALELARLVEVAVLRANADSARAQVVESLLSDRVAAIRLGDRQSVQLEVTRDPSVMTHAPAPVSPSSSSTWRSDGVWVTRMLNSNETLLVFVNHPASAFARLDALLLLYMFIIALALLAGAYFIVTYRIIRPLGAVSRAATRVMSPQRELALPLARSREFADLNSSLEAMTKRLLAEEVELRGKIREVEEATEQLKVAQAQLVRSERMATVGQLAAGLAHEIGNPIAAIIGLQDLILEGDLPIEQQTEFLRRMRKESERINRVLRELLQFARPRSETWSSTPEKVDISEVLEETLTLVRPQPSFRDVTVRTIIAPDLPLASATHEGLTQVLLNLLLNAAHACQSQGEIRICAQLQDDQIVLSVEDTGEGVPEALRETMFQPFVSGKDAGQGTGLGLSVCRSLVEQFGTGEATKGSRSQNGSIELDPTYTNGARLVVRLPIASTADR